jgi:hypothetical protein
MLGLVRDAMGEHAPVRAKRWGRFRAVDFCLVQIQCGQLEKKGWGCREEAYLWQTRRDRVFIIWRRLCLLSDDDADDFDDDERRLLSCGRRTKDPDLCCCARVLFSRERATWL